MKAWALILGLGFLANSALAAEFLTDVEKASVLKRLNITCGDTWCESDYDYEFQTLNCDSATANCEIGLTRQLRGFHHSAPMEDHACVVSGFTSFDSILEVVRPDHTELRDSFYQAVNRCIDQIPEQP